MNPNRNAAVLDAIIDLSDRLASYRRELANIHGDLARSACEHLARAERHIDDAVAAIPYAD